MTSLATNSGYLANVVLLKDCIPSLFSKPFNKT